MPRSHHGPWSPTAPSATLLGGRVADVRAGRGVVCPAGSIRCGNWGDPARESPHFGAPPSRRTRSITWRSQRTWDAVIGFTFDGIHTTNGFHPLWQFLLVPVVRVFGPATDTTLRAVLLLALVCSLAAVLLFVRLVWRSVGAGAALLGGVVATQLGLPQWVNGMEGAVVLLALALVATALAATDRNRSRTGAIVVGCSTALLVLARLDFLPLLLVLGVAAASRWRSAALARPLASWRRHCRRARGGVVARVVGPLAVDQRDREERDALERLHGAVWRPFYLGLCGLRRRRRTQLHRGSLAVVVPLAPLTCRPLLRRAPSRSGALWPRTARTRGAGVRGRRPPVDRRVARRRVGICSSETWSLAVIAVVVLLKAGLDVVDAPLWAGAWYSAPQRLLAGFAVGISAVVGSEHCGSTDTPRRSHRDRGTRRPRPPGERVGMG